MYNLIIADDHEIIFYAIKNLLYPYTRFKIIAKTNKGNSLYKICCLHKPDILILDLNLPDINGLNLISKLHYEIPEMSILAYTAFTEEKIAIRAFSDGVKGYVLKNSKKQILLAAIQTVAVKKVYIDPSLNRKTILQKIKNKKRFFILSFREKQILQLISLGYTNKKIAENLFISVKTVETHRLNIMRKLSVHKVTELLNFSRKLGLIQD
ncbi:two component system response regulator [bacterium endosymbiont of Pedicinus badii]|uniref:two component system response regulator n=1 Tax=bacterium endosymbiont of Pedicinus badii TaxID=1719126 RepID=UPI0009BAFB7F|nr:two component system response regulator [bacterium endosymbiont of Pedicinus badii]OQM34425.1 hypothetical protein AOQ89_00860 [bacterium endosymbiont of Pedicinus badii]